MEQIYINAPQALSLARIAFACFFAILFLQSGFDKVFNFKETLSWLVGHFANTFLSALVPIMFILLTLCEVLAGVISAYGIVELIVHKSSTVAYYGAAFSIVSLLFLFFGQRIANDYNGAGGLVSYFVASIFGLLILA